MTPAAALGRNASRIVLQATGSLRYDLYAGPVSASLSWNKGFTEKKRTEVSFLGSWPWKETFTESKKGLCCVGSVRWRRSFFCESGRCTNCPLRSVALWRPLTNGCVARRASSSFGSSEGHFAGPFVDL